MTKRELRQIADMLEWAAGSGCEHLHHRKQDQHHIGAECPVTVRYLAMAARIRRSLRLSEGYVEVRL